MPGKLDKKALLAKRLGDAEDVEIPGVGTVTVRGLSRAQALTLQGEAVDETTMERRLVSLGMVDPALTEDEVAEWQANTAAGELVPIVNAVLRLSGMAAEVAGKAAFPSVRG
jgi:hypothetical protein